MLTSGLLSNTSYPDKEADSDATIAHIYIPTALPVVNSFASRQIRLSFPLSRHFDVLPNLTLPGSKMMPTATTTNDRAQAGREDQNNFRKANNHLLFPDPPLTCRPKLFCCPVAESNPAHLPRSFVNPGRHLMNLQLRSFLECADEPKLSLPKCDVSHIVEVTARVLQNPSAVRSNNQVEQEQWNVQAIVGNGDPFAIKTPPLEEEEEEGECTVMRDEAMQEDIPYSTYQAMSSRHFITQSSNNIWQIPPHSRQYRDSHPESHHTRNRMERYMEIPPFKTMPYTSDGSASTNSGTVTSRPWIPSCSMLMWCTRHNMFYEVHVLS